MSETQELLAKKFLLIDDGKLGGTCQITVTVAIMSVAANEKKWKCGDGDVEHNGYCRLNCFKTHIGVCYKITLAM